MGGMFNSPLAGLSKFAGGLFAVDKAFDLVKQGLQITSDIQRVDASISAVSSSSLDFARTQSFLLGLSDSLGVSYTALADSYKGIKAATNGTALAGDETERIFTSIVKAGAALKLSNEDIKGSLLAVSQMLGKGTVSAEEFRQQFAERVPAAMKLAAQAMGLTDPEFNKLLESGELMATDLLPKLATELEKTFGSKAQANVSTMAGGYVRLTNQAQLFISEFAKTTGIDTFFGKLSNYIADTIKDLRRLQKGTLQNELDDFNGLAPDKRKGRLGSLGRSIVKDEARLNQLTDQSPTDKNTKEEVELERRIKAKKRLFGEMFMAVRHDAEEAAKATKNALNAKNVVDPIKLLEQKKARLNFLSDKKDGLSFSGGSLSKAEARELTILEKKFEGFKKSSKETNSLSMSTLENFKLAKKLIEEEIQKKQSLQIDVPRETFFELEKVN